ncbi:hypothetical protein [Pseudarthrobacter polychromogenes]|uniref:PE-PPE domain-containing protein n=1 Tax=Pseudarthrobacter polychromogenes TaxID=1676 RepID=A0ABQ1XMG8_9MICC|nr:hypothetical protein [Pseudarthrobacter polychromogenes]GGG97675.1 hypothetical protein GCM10011577_21290 [Pseudarthrobacter polychromogenes]
MAEATPSGTGGPVRVTGPEQDGPLTIRGGVGGISFQLEELAAGAEKVDALAGRLAGVEAEVRRIWEELIPFQDQPRWTGTMALSAVGESERSLQAVRTELQRISSQVRACRQEYEMAEARAAAERSLGMMGIGDLGNALVNVSVTGAADERTMETLVASLGLDAPGVKKRIEKEPWPWEVLEDAGAFNRPLVLDRQETVSIDLDSSPAGLLERIRLIDARGPGFIEVIQVHGGGKSAYVVVIPGTQPELLSAGGNNPLDEVGVGEAMLYDSDEMNMAALQALNAAGAGQGDPVVAVGYSQGGIHAMNLAADPRFLRQYDLRYVLTAGSPVAGINAAPGVQSLHLEHRADWVPGSDGAPNPDTKDRVTVSMGHAPRAAEGEGGLGTGHTLTTYQDGARLVSASDDPSLVQSTAALGAVLGAGGTATAMRFSLARTPAPASHLHAADLRRRERGHGGR